MASEDVQTQLTFKLDTFEGPLDLLLQLIKKMRWISMIFK